MAARFDDKVAIVTGGGQGIGRATCELFAKQGAEVVVVDRNRAAADEVAQAITAAGGKSLALYTDVADERAVEQMVADTIEKFGRIDVLVNNAAVFILKGVDATVDEWREILDTNVIGTAMVTKHVVPHMRNQGGGAIVNLGSISSFIAQPKFVTYNATKAAVVSMTRCMALDLAADNIRVNAACPGAVWTSIVQRITSEDGLDRAAADAHPDWGGAHLLNRIAEPHEIAYAILFLSCDEASFITGETLMVDGGYMAR